MYEELLDICRGNIKQLKTEIVYNDYYIQWRHADKETILSNKKDIKVNRNKLKIEEVDEQYYMSKVLENVPVPQKPWYQFWGQ